MAISNTQAAIAIPLLTLGIVVGLGVLCVCTNISSSDWHGDETAVGGAAILVMLLPVVPVYFLPAIIANIRGHNRSLAIFLVTLLFGFTGIVWLVMFFWAIMGESAKSEARKARLLVQAMHS